MSQWISIFRTGKNSVFAPRSALSPKSTQKESSRPTHRNTRLITCYCTSSVEVTFDRQNSRLFAETVSTFVDILCRKSFGNSRTVRRERIFCVIRRELATSRRRFELSANLHRRSWILRWLLIDDSRSQWNWWDDARTFLNNYLKIT